MPPESTVTTVGPPRIVGHSAPNRMNFLAQDSSVAEGVPGRSTGVASSPEKPSRTGIGGGGGDGGGIDGGGLGEGGGEGGGGGGGAGGGLGGCGGGEGGDGGGGGG